MPSISPFIMPAALLLLGSLSCVSAHGFVKDIIIDGQHFEGFDATNAAFTPQPPSIAWTHEGDDAYIRPFRYASSDIICHVNATPASESATVAAGSSIDLQWSKWYHDHQGPIINYLAPCDGDCATVNKTELRFFKIQEAGLFNNTPPALLATQEMIDSGTVMDDRIAVKLATEEMMANNLTTSVTIPASIAPGNYVLRHELFGLRYARSPNGAQNYPQCFNLMITGSGTETPPGIPATEFYNSTDPGISFDIWTPTDTYIIPGPPLYTEGASGITNSSNSVSSTSSSAASSTATPFWNSLSSSMMEGTGAVTPTPAYPGSAWQSGMANPTNASLSDEMTSTTTMYSTITLTATVTTGEASMTSNETVSPGTSLATPSANPTNSSTSPLQSAVQSAAQAVDSMQPDTEVPSGLSWPQFVDWLKQILGQHFDQAGQRNHARQLDF